MIMKTGGGEKEKKVLNVLKYVFFFQNEASAKNKIGVATSDSESGEKREREDVTYLLTFARFHGCH